MKRKVIKQASQAYTITLPISWARENNLGKNSEVDVEVSGRFLLISSGKPIKGSTIKIDLNDVDFKQIYRHITAAYAKGVDELNIVSSKDISSTITRALNSLIGYALISHEGDMYKIKDINPGNYPDLDEIFKRVFQIILLFYDAAIKDIFGKENETLENLRARDNEVNKFCFYLQRAINKMSYSNQVKDRTIFTYSFELEKISDEIQRLWRTNINHKIKKSEEIKKITEMSKESIEKAFDSYYQFDNEAISEIYDLREKIRKKSLSFSKLDSNTTRFLRHVVKIAEDAADLNHLTLIKNL
ncbi:MAG TPA: phosphate uptake regulator PhoU [Candidatus Nanoarchaeia archaeon]|nr:phosphate uptake regulator PhoU [Candidatus Nanoarchaeia archaeon]